MKVWIAGGRARPPGPGLGGGTGEAIAGRSEGRVIAPWGRSGDDLLLMYTGGTTGMPSSVM